MLTPAAPVLRDLVLVGGGHSHVTVLKQFGMRPMAGVRLTLITATMHTPYSGMLPGYLSGFYTHDDVHIDLARLARFAGARLVHAEAVGLDVQAQRVLLRGGRPLLRYDLLSLNLGITPALSRVPGAAQHTTPVKPISGLVPRFEALLRKAAAVDAAAAAAAAPPSPLRVVVVGGGAAGVELACALCHRLVAERQKGGGGGAAGTAGASDAATSVHVSLVSRGPILQGQTPYARRAFLPLLQERGIELLEVPGGVAEVTQGELLLGDGRRLPFDECLWATQAAAAGWLADTGLPVDADGFLLVDECLRSAGGPPNVFAAGDVASCPAHPRPKAGVFAVRAGPPLADNLRRVLAGQAPVPWRPQATFLSLISVGDKYAVGTKGWIGVQGGWLWAWKDRIDRAFVAKFGADLDFSAMQGGGPQQQQGQQQQQQQQQGPAVAASVEELALLAAARMRCGGCGSKVGATTLDRVLARLRREAAEADAEQAGAEAAVGGGGSGSSSGKGAVLLGLDAPDDCAVLEPPPPGHVTVQTVDFFRSMLGDPYTFGAIAANHALSDCHAMGAAPVAALATAVVPLAGAAVQEEELYQMMAGAGASLRAAGCVLVGGHSSEGAEAALGFSVTGSALRSALLTKGDVRAGQSALVLTKALGTGTILAAEMRGGARGRWLEGAVASMLQSNGPAVPVLRAHGATACTDVTGFGLLGHLAEMGRASRVVLEVDTAAVPLLEGAAECVAGGYLSSLHPENARVAAALQSGGGGSSSIGDGDGVGGLQPGMFALLVDPQTAGGLLAAVPAGEAAACVSELRLAGYPHAAVVAWAAEPLVAGGELEAGRCLRLLRRPSAGAAMLGNPI